MRTLLYFTASWCRPCEKMKPLVEKMHENNQDFILEIIDVDYAKGHREKFAISSVPTFILIENDVEIKRISGAKTEDFMKDFIYG